MQDREITLFIPGLLEARLLLPLKDELEVPDLELLLARSRPRRFSYLSDESLLFQHFNIAVAAGVDAPVAALTRLVDQKERDDHYWLRADPVHVQPSRDQVMMFGNQQLNVQHDEMLQLRDEFNRFFAEDGLILETPVNDRWYLRLDAVPQITTQPLREVVGQDIHPHLPQGLDALYWHKLINEVQMLFYNSEVNQRRRQQGRPEINSVWLWGGGVLPEITPANKAPWQCLWSNEVLSRGLARLTGVTEVSLPASGEEWLEQSQQSQCEQKGQHLIVFEAEDEVRLGDLWRCKTFLEGISQHWIAPLLAALKHGELGRISLLSNEYEFRLAARQLRRWWKRPRPLASYI